MTTFWKQKTKAESQNLNSRVQNPEYFIDFVIKEILLSRIGRETLIYFLLLWLDEEDGNAEMEMDEERGSNA